MAPDRLPVRDWRIRGSGLGPPAAPTRPLSAQNSLEVDVRPVFGHASGPDGHSIPIPIWRVVQPRGIGAVVLDHEVSGTDVQSVGLGIVSITAMMPVRQCGHSRNDRPVSAS